jgi:hypothetical protein
MRVANNTHTLQKFSTISVDKTVQKPTVNWLTMLFQKKFL